MLVRRRRSANRCSNVCRKSVATPDLRMISVCRISMVDSRRWFMCSCIVRQGLVPRAGGLLERGPIGGVRLSRPVGPSCWMCVAHRMSPPVQSPNDDRAIARINHRLRLCNERRHTTSDTHATSVPAHRCRFQSGSSEVHDEPPYHCWPDRSAPLAQSTSLSVKYTKVC